MDDGPRLRCHILDTGHCLASEHHLITGGRNRTVACHSVVALLNHPRHGWFLWDAGYAPRLWRETRRWPFRVYSWVTPMRLRPELAVVAQLPRYGLKASDVRRVILSHFHADHIAGLRDFPLAEIITSRFGYEDVAGRTGWRALARAFVPALLPEDFERRALLLPPHPLALSPTRGEGEADSGLSPPSPTRGEGGGGGEGEAFADFGPVHDLFDDGSALLVPLPGHARGQLGLLAGTERGPLFFVADSCWLSASYRDNRPPHRVTHFFIDDAAAMRATLARLHRFAAAHADVALVPSHCPEAFARYAER
jgi:glyoxylase-like metal-dependent hydrolase (beta-lactamase superfamily II)